MRRRIFGIKTKGNSFGRRPKRTRVKPFASKAREDADNPYSETYRYQSLVKRLGGAVYSFIAENRSMLFYYLLFLSGVVFGVLTFSVSRDSLIKEFKYLLIINSPADSIVNGIKDALVSALPTFIMVVIMFIAGLSATGAVISLAVPVFLGFGIGLSAGYHYFSGFGGIAINAILIIPPALFSSAAVVLASMESVKLSLLIGGQLVSRPRNIRINRQDAQQLDLADNKGVLSRDFKIYCLRFIVFLFLTLASGVMDVLLKVFFAKLLR